MVVQMFHIYQKQNAFSVCKTAIELMPLLNLMVSFTQMCELMSMLSLPKYIT